jgi:hypothetical protein
MLVMNGVLFYGVMIYDTFWLRRLINVLEINLQLEAGFFGSNKKRACEARLLSVLIINFPVSQVSIYQVFWFCYYLYHHVCYLHVSAPASVSRFCVRLM